VCGGLVRELSNPSRRRDASGGSTCHGQVVWCKGGDFVTWAEVTLLMLRSRNQSQTSGGSSPIHSVPVQAYKPQLIKDVCLSWLPALNHSWTWSSGTALHAKSCSVRAVLRCHRISSCLHAQEPAKTCSPASCAPSSRCAAHCRYTDDAAHTAYTGSAEYLKMERAALGDDFDWVRICNKFRCKSV
jgi:hypothetical protein